MLKLKKLASLIMCVVACAAVFSGCGDDSNSAAGKASDSKDNSVEVSDSTNDESSVAQSAGSVMNFTAPKEGEDIIVMTIKDYGDVKIKLFSEQASKGVENFTGLASQGYYDGLIFHRIISDFMIQGGDPQGTGMGGESIWGEKFDGGTSADVSHFAGAVAYANSGSTATNGSQFYIVTGEVSTDESLSQIAEYYGTSFSDEAKELYKTIGGTPFLDGNYTVFGQVFDGLDIIFDVQNVDTDANDKPTKDVVIEKVSVEKYDGGDVKFYMSDYK